MLICNILYNTIIKIIVDHPIGETCKRIKAADWRRSARSSIKTIAEKMARSSHTGQSRYVYLINCTFILLRDTNIILSNRFKTTYSETSYERREYSSSIALRKQRNKSGRHAFSKYTNILCVQQ